MPNFFFANLPPEPAPTRAKTTDDTTDSRPLIRSKACMNLAEMFKDATGTVNTEERAATTATTPRSSL